MRRVGSGPAAAPAAAVQIASEFFPRSEINVISADMGGTSFDVGLIRGGLPALTRNLRIAGMPLGSLATDIISIGAGGGSIASIDAGGALAVGPQSAGADPGPACYGLGGTQPTVTDAFVALGYVNPDAFLGGRLKLDRDKALSAIDTEVAQPLGLGIVDAAAGIFRLANFKMVKAMAAVSIERGVDPCSTILIARGGAGGVVVGSLTDEFGIDRAIIPRVAGGYSAFGMTVVDVTFDYTRTFTTDSDTADVDAINRLFAEMEEDALRNLAASAIPTDDVQSTPSTACSPRWKRTRCAISRQARSPRTTQFQWFYDAAYWGQAHELIVPLAKGRFEDVSDLRRAFDDEHERIYTFKMEGGDRVNFLHWRVNAVVGSSMPMPRRSASASDDPAAALTGYRTAYFGGEAGATEVPVYDGMQLEPGHVVRGAAVIGDATRRHAGSFRHVALRSVDRDLRQYRRGGDHRCRLQGIRNGRPPAQDRRRRAGGIDL